MERVSKNLRLYVLGALFISASLIWYIVLTESVTSKLVVSVLDVGQGDAIFIESPAKIQVLVDGGPNSKVLSALGDVMPFYDRSIDLLVVSNSDKDHIAGFVGVLKKYKVGAILIPGTDPDTEIYRSLIESAKLSGAGIFEARRGEKILIGDGAYIEVLFPDRDPSGLDTNTGSIIARLVYGESSMLFTGDAPSAVEEYLVKLDGEKLKSDILKVGHHGSKTSISEMFFGIVNPQVAAISVGAGNMYGHPNKETLDMLNRFGIETLRTDKIGTIRFVSDGKNFKLITNN